MRSFCFSVSVLLLFAFALYAAPPAPCQSATAQNHTPLRVAIVGLVHGHVQGFLDHSLHNREIEIVGIAESNPGPRFPIRGAL